MMSELLRIYLAGPVQYEEDGGTGWRSKAEQIFKQAAEDKDIRIKVFNPTSFFTYEDAKHQSDSQVKNYYMDQILHSRLVLVSLDHTATSPGTAEELQYAVCNHIPIIGFGSGDNIYNWLKVDCQCIFPSLLQAIDYIIEHYCN